MTAPQKYTVHANVSVVNVTVVIAVGYRYLLAVMRRRYVFEGTVQGVGFRPTVFRVATGLGLSGFVQNRRSEVIAEVQGREHEVSAFLTRLRAQLPKAARIEMVRESEVAPELDGMGFSIRNSESDHYAFPPIPPDLPLCPECAREMLDPGDRRYLTPSSHAPSVVRVIR